MVYIYTKRIGLNKYYYLRLDKIVNGKKITKDIIYLGNNLSKIDINKLLDNQIYKKEIRKSYKTINKFLKSNYYIEKAESIKYKKNKYLTKEQLIKLKAIELHFNSKFKKLHELTKNEFFENFIISYTYNTTSIEGNTIPLSDVKKILLDDNIILKNKTLREIYDLRNTKNTFNYILNNKLKINFKTIIELHKELMKDIDNRLKFRNYDVRVTKSHFDTTPYFRIEKELKQLIGWYGRSKQNIFIKATIFHHKFEKIHPFADGNGRTGRMLFNLILLQNKLPPIIITKKNKNKYFDSLMVADKKEDYLPLISFLLEEYEKGYWDNFVI